MLCRRDRGSSTSILSPRERIELADRFIHLAGENSINHLMSDRKFIGSEWLGYLNARGIHYHIRIRENFRVIRHGQETREFWLFGDLKLGECKHLDGIYYVNVQACYLGFWNRSSREVRFVQRSCPSLKTLLKRLVNETGSTFIPSPNTWTGTRYRRCK